MSFKSLVKLIPLSVVIFVSCASRSVVEKPSTYASKEKTKPPMEKPFQKNGKSANLKEIQPERIVQKENTKPLKVKEIHQTLSEESKKESSLHNKGMAGAKSSIRREVLSSTLKEELINTAKLAALKGTPVVRKFDGTIIEAVPKGGKNNCKQVFLKVKTSKGEKDYTATVCGNKVEIESR